MTFLPRTFANDVQMQHFSFSLLIVSIGVLFLPVPCVATHIDETVFRLPAEHIQAPGGICVAGCKIAGTAVCDLIRFPFDLSALPCQLRFHLMQPQQVTVPTAGKLKTKYRCFVFIFPPALCDGILIAYSLNPSGSICVTITACVAAIASCHCSAPGGQATYRSAPSGCSGRLCQMFDIANGSGALTVARS